MGLMNGPEVLQQYNVNIFDDIKGVQIYFDDMIVCGKDQKEHDRNLEKVVLRTRENKIKFNVNKTTK